MKSDISSGNMSTAEVSKTTKGLPSVESDVMLERDGTLPEQKLERKRSLTHDLIGFAKHNMNPAVSFLLLASQLYLTYLAIFERSFLDPFQTSNSMTHYNITDGTTPREEAVNAIFGTSTLSILVIVLAGLAGAALVQFCRLPGLLGMLLAGILLRNMPYTGAVMLVVKEWGVVLRRLAFIVILLRGGLSLDANALRKLKGACFRLALIPCTVEAVAVAAASRLILGMDILYGLMLGFVLAAVSPAVIVPAMLDAAANGYGTGAGIPSLVVAAASLDDVYAITMFSLLVSVVFSTGSSIVVTLIRAPIEVVSGVFFGTIIGLVLRYFPSSSHRHFHAFRFSLLAAFACSALFGTTALGVDSIGAIAVLVLAFVASQRWKSDEMSQVSREEESKSSELEDEDRETEIPQLVEEYGLAVAWECVFQPLLFGLIGFQLSFDMLSLRTVSLGLGVLCVGLVFRTIATSLAVLGSGLDFKERLFVSLAWLPKATVQAALAPVALDMARSRHDDPDEESVVFSTLIFAVAVLSILTTAPIGALLIQLTTPKLLKKVIMFKLDCSYQNYAWGKLGADSEVAQLVKEGGHAPNVDDSKPYAELWMGVHKNGPSKIRGQEQLLADLIQKETNMVGAHEKGSLQFLFKVLSVRSALSVQTHPTKEQAALLHAKDPKNYPDANHKPEMAIALTKFQLLCGFRPANEIHDHIRACPELLSLLDGHAFQLELLMSGTVAEQQAALRVIFTIIWNSPQDEITAAVHNMITRIKIQEKKSELDELLIRLDSEYPGGDVGVFAPLILNYFTLAPGEATFLGPNRPHAYLFGDCIECMAASDNTIRAGLTPKYKDIHTLCSNLQYTMSGPPLFPCSQQADGVRLYAPAVPEFAVQEIRAHALPIACHGTSSLIIVISGAGLLDSTTSQLAVTRGDVVFSAASLAQIQVRDATSDFMAFRAYTPSPQLP